MHGLPADVNLSFLRGVLLEQVCLGEYQFQLRFSGGASIEVEAEFTLDGDRHSIGEGSLLSSLLGRSVREAGVTGAGDLRLEFEGQRSLVIHDSNEGYESFVICGRGGVTIVV